MRALLRDGSGPRRIETGLWNPPGMAVGRAGLVDVPVGREGFELLATLEGCSGPQFAYLPGKWLDADLVHALEAVHLLRCGRDP